MNTSTSVTVGLTDEQFKKDIALFSKHLDEVIGSTSGFAELSQMGMVNSAVYRAQVMELFKAKPLVLTQVLLAFTFFKKRDRALRILRTLEFKDAEQAVLDHVVSAADRGRRRGAIADVNITSGFPEMSALFIGANLAKDVKAGKISIENAVTRFIQNQAIGQLNLSTELQEEHKKWEQSFWENDVKLKGGKPAKFEPAFYENKINDKFRLITKTGEMYGTATPITREIIKSYITHFQ
jgi:hypothetical protein